MAERGRRRLRHASRRVRDESGQTTVIGVGFAVVLMMLVAMVVDASAAFRHRQGLANLADGAALWAADAGAQGGEVYGGGLGERPLRLTAPAARDGVTEYLRTVGAYRDYPGLRHEVVVRGDEVSVRILAPVDLPITAPGLPESATVSATSSAIVDPE